MDLFTGAENSKKIWIIVIALSLLIFFASLGLRYLFEKRLDFIYAIMATVFCVVAYFAVVIFLNIKK